MTLAAELFAEDEWRILWWETAVRLGASPDFPVDADDVSFLAYAAEAAVRHWNAPFIVAVRRVVERVLVHPLVSLPELEEERRLLDAFLDECRNPLLGCEREIGPWTPRDPDPHESELTRIDDGVGWNFEGSIPDALRDALEHRFGVQWLRSWGGRLGGYRPLSARVAAARAELERRSLPALRIGSAGELFLVAASAGEYKACASVLGREGLVLDERPPDLEEGPPDLDPIPIELVDLWLTHRRAGNVLWEGWWVAEQGEIKDDPTLDQYVSFVSFGLLERGLPRAERVGPDGVVVRNVAPAQVDAVTAVASYHGFDARVDRRADG